MTVPRTIYDGLTMENLDESIDAILGAWDAADWRAFSERYVNLQFGTKDRPRPRATIPAQADDDDLILWRVIEHARAHLEAVNSESKAQSETSSANPADTALKAG